MAIHQFPLIPSVPDYTIGVVLDQQHYTMRVYWNASDAAWYFDIYDTGGALILPGVKIVLGAYLGRVSGKAPFTTGVIAAVDTSGDELDAGFDDLGARVQLYYVPVADLMVNLTNLTLSKSAT